MFNKEVYVKRRNELRTKMSSGIALILGNSDSSMSYPANIFKFRQDSSFLYFFGLEYPNFAGVIDIDENKDYIFGNDVDIEDIIWMGPQVSLVEKAQKVGITNTAPFNNIASLLLDAIKQGRKIHFVPQYRADNLMLLEKLIGIHSTKVNDYVSVELIKNIISLREIKDKYEIAEMEKAAATGYDMHVTAMKMAKPGIYEREIAGAIEGISLSAGGNLSFPVILSQHGETLHNHDHSKILESGKMMLTDAGAETAMNYCSDFTRTIPVNGKFTQQQKDIYNIVLNANNAAIEAIRPGVAYREIHDLSALTVANGLKSLGIMKGNMEEAVKLGAHAVVYPHGLGHMIGLDVHDMEGFGETYVGYNDEIKRSDIFGTAYLRLGKKLKPGFALTTEPGIYFIPELIKNWRAEKKHTDFINYDKLESFIGFGGIRLEDDILITETGHKFIGKRIPITVEEVEATMAK